VTVRRWIEGWGEDCAWVDLTYFVARNQRVDTAVGSCCFSAGNAVAYGLFGWHDCQNELHVVERGLHGGTYDGYWLALVLVGPVAADAASFDHD
jgi:hypothetical protein